MTPDKEHTPALMQQAADEAVARTVHRLRQAAGIMLNHTTATRDVRDELGTAVDEAADTIATLTAQLAAASAKGVAAGLEMAAKVADDLADAKLEDEEWALYYAVGRGEVASAIRALADQHKPSPAEGPTP